MEGGDEWGDGSKVVMGKPCATRTPEDLPLRRGGRLGSKIALVVARRTLAGGVCGVSEDQCVGGGQNDMGVL